MSKTKYLKFKGLAAWCRLYPGQEDDFRDEKKYKMNFYPSKEVDQQIKEAGIQTRPKEDDGEKSGVAGRYYTFKRELEREFSGVVQQLEPVKVYDKDGKLYLDNKPSIGNGSLVEVTLEVYETKRFGKGCRLNSVRILDLIEYVRPDSDDDEIRVDDTPDPEVIEDGNVRKVPW